MFDVKFNRTNEFYEEFEDDMLELESETVLNELNKMYNKKGFNTADYINYMND